MATSNSRGLVGYNGDEIIACEAAGIVPIVSKPMTSSAKAEGRFDKKKGNPGCMV